MLLGICRRELGLGTVGPGLRSARRSWGQRAGGRGSRRASPHGGLERWRKEGAGPGSGLLPGELGHTGIWSSVGWACPRLPRDSPALLPWAPPRPESRERGLGPSGWSTAGGGRGFCAGGWAGKKQGATGRMVGTPRFRLPPSLSCAPWAGEALGSGGRSRSRGARRSPEWWGRGPPFFAVGAAGSGEACRWEPAQPRARSAW